MIPHYLIKSLSSLGIDSIEELSKYDYKKIYRWLKITNPTFGHNILYHLYSLINNLPINSLTSTDKQQMLHSYRKQEHSYPPLPKDLINYYLSKALIQAEIAMFKHEVPVGAVLVEDNKIIAHAHNRVLNDSAPTQHAEIVAINYALDDLGRYNLINCDLYVTIEPCLMCSGAIMQTHIRRLIFGAVSPMTGAVSSQYSVFSNRQVNHHTEVIGPIDNHKYGEIMKNFFIQQRTLK